MAESGLRHGRGSALWKYWVHGEGAAKIGWGTDGSFDRCVRLVGAEVEDPKVSIKGLCANLHKDATGEWPAEKGVPSDMETVTAAGYARIRFAGYVAPVDQLTGDRRTFAAGALRSRPLPQPMSFQAKSVPGHQESVVVGRIDMFEARALGWWAQGEFLDPGLVPEVAKAIYLLQQKVIGPSVDLEPGTYTYEERPYPGDPNGRPLMRVLEGTCAGFTLVARPAFSGLILAVEDGDTDLWEPDIQVSVEDEIQEAILASAGCFFTVNTSTWQNMPIGERETEFNADDAITRLAEWSGGDPAKFRRGFLYQDKSGDPGARETYRLPVADVYNGKLVLVPRAVFSAAALLSGAHGGLRDVSEPDVNELQRVVTDIYASLADHFSDDRIRPPWTRGGRQDAVDATASSLVEHFMTYDMVTGQPINGAMVALVPDQESVERLALDPAMTGAQPASEMHLTVCCFDDASALSASERAAFLDGAEAVASAYEPINADAFGTALLNPQSDTPCWVYLVSGLSVDRIARSLWAYVGSSQDQKVPWLSHVTAAYYSGDLTWETAGKLGPVRFDRIRVAYGDQVTDFPLGIRADMPGPQEEPMVQPDTYFASNPKEPYGDVTYADPGYQEDGKRRYPIDTAEHVRAAWSYINKEKNAALYSPGDLKKVKDRIKAAAKKFKIQISDEAATASLIASFLPARPPASWFSNPTFTKPTALRVTDTGQVFGHLASWNTCHTSFSDKCVMAPRTATDYAYFKTGEVLCDNGAMVPAGRVTVGTGHAHPTLGMVPAVAHYDNTGTAVAAVSVGEDRFGIWVAGAIVSDAPEALVAALRLSPLSGDWRRVGGNLELVAALAVNSPGFPVIREQDERTYSLCAAGIVNSEVEENYSADDARPGEKLQAVDEYLGGLLSRDRAQRVKAMLGRE